MYVKSIIIKLILFVVAFTILFWTVKINNVLPRSSLNADMQSIPVLLGLGNFLFSIISGFVIQQQWRKWDILMDASRGEVSMLRQLYIVAHHFPVKERNAIRFHIYRYLDMLIKSRQSKNLHLRSKKVDEALIRIEDTMFSVSKRYPDIGNFAFTHLTRAMEYRETKLQSSSHRLPMAIRVFLFFATGTVIVGSLFLPFVNLYYNYYFALVAASIAFGILLIVDDFDHPLQPGIYYLSADAYKSLRDEIRSKLEYYAFDFNKAEARELTNGHAA